MKNERKSSRSSSWTMTTTSSIPALERLLDDQEDRRLGDPVPVDDREQLLLRRLRGREQARAEAGGGDERAADARAGAEREGEARHAEVALEHLDRGLLVGRAPRDELRRAVALRADALAAPDVRLHRRVGEHAVEHGRGELLRAGGRGVAVELAPAPRSSARRAARRPRRAGPRPPRVTSRCSSARAAPARRARPRPRRTGRQRLSRLRISTVSFFALRSTMTKCSSRAGRISLGLEPVAVELHQHRRGRRTRSPGPCARSARAS